MDLDTLWQVEDEFVRVPQWSTMVSPGRRNAKAAGVSAEPKRRSGGHETLQTPDGNEVNSTSSLPELLLSDYSADSDAAKSGADDSEAESVDVDGEELDEYDYEEEAELRDLLREAMDIAIAHPEIFEEKKSFKKRSNDNQFLKALGALRGKWCRLFI